MQSKRGLYAAELVVREVFVRGSIKYLHVLESYMQGSQSGLYIYDALTDSFRYFDCQQYRVPQASCSLGWSLCASVLHVPPDLLCTPKSRTGICSQGNITAFEPHLQAEMSRQREASPRGARPSRRNLFSENVRYLHRPISPCIMRKVLKDGYPLADSRGGRL